MLRTALFFALVFCSRGFAAGGEFKYALRIHPVTLNPLLAADNYSTQVMRWLAESLLTHDEETYAWVPCLAESYSVSKDGRVIEFVIRDGVQFHDGTRLSAEDVKFSLKVHNSGFYGPTSEYEGMRNFDRVDVVSPRRLRVHATRAFALNLDTLARLPIVPKALYGDKSNLARLNVTVIGTGPYRLKEYQNGSRLVLERNSEWWGNKIFPSKFNFARIIARVVEDEIVRLEMLEKGDLDYAEVKLDSVLKHASKKPWGERVFIEKARPLALYTTQQSYFLNLRRPLFASLKTRRALQMLLNRDFMNEKLRGGKSLLATGPWHRLGEYSDQTLKAVAFDEAGARKLLAEDGWVEDAERGVLTRMINGRKTPFEFNFIYPTRDSERELSLYQASLKNVGIKMNLRQVDWGIMSKNLDELDFDAFVIGRGWPGVIDFDPNGEWNSKFIGKNQANTIGYQNAVVDRLMERAELEMNRTRRMALLKDVYRKIAADQAQIFTFSDVETYYARSARVQIPKPYFKYEIGMDYWSSKGE